MDDNKHIPECNIENGDVVHLIARINENNERLSINNINNIFRDEYYYISPFNRNSRSHSPLTSIITYPFSNENNSTNNSGNNESGNSRRTVHFLSPISNYFRLPPEYAQQPTINSDEIRETIAQNLLSIQNIIEYGNFN